MDNPKVNVIESGIQFKQQIFQSDTRQGVKFMFFALTLVFIEMIVSAFTFIFSSFITTEDPFSTGTVTASFFGFTISFILIFLYFIFFLLAIYSFNRGRFELDHDHKNDVDLAKYFIISYVVILGIFYLLVIPLLVIFLPWDSYYIGPSLSQIVNIILSFLIAFSILFLVRNFVGKFERELLYLFAILLISITIFSALIEMFMFIRINRIETSTGFLKVLVFEIINILIWILPVLAYRRILKGFDTSGVYRPMSSKNDIPKIKRFIPITNRFFSKPMKSFFVVFIIACVIGGGSGFLLKEVIGDRSYRSECDPGPDYIEPIISSMTFSGTDSVTENSGKSYDYEIGDYIQEYTFTLSWRDEPDLILRTNEPDCFTLEIAIENESDKKTGENIQGENGLLVSKGVYTIEDSFWVNSILIYITLDYAGDQLGPGGRQQSPMTVSDNSNDYHFELSVVCCENLE